MSFPEISEYDSKTTLWVCTLYKSIQKQLSSEYDSHSTISVGTFLQTKQTSLFYNLVGGLHFLGMWKLILGNNSIS